MKAFNTILATGVVAVAAAVGASFAVAASHEAPQLVPNGAPSGYLKINPQTCKFIHPEIDVRPGGMERYARAEDSRDDVKLSCLTRKLNHVQPAAPDKDGVTGYVQVKAHGTGKTVTASCPAGDVVLGGGSPDETTGSYPSSASSWTIVRDHLSPPTMTAVAVCATKAA